MGYASGNARDAVVIAQEVARIVALEDVKGVVPAHAKKVVREDAMRDVKGLAKELINTLHYHL